MLWKNRVIRFNLTLNLWYDFREQNYRALLLILVEILNYLSLVVTNWALSLIILKTRDALFWGSILTPNARNLSLIILYLKPKVDNVLTKTSVRPVFYKKCFAWFILYINIFENTCIKNAKFNIFYQYVLFLTKVKQFSNLKKKKEVGVTLLTVISLYDIG